MDNMLNEQQIIETLKRLKEDLEDNKYKQVCVICHEPFIGTKHQKKCTACIFKNDNI